MDVPRYLHSLGYFLFNINDNFILLIEGKLAVRDIRANFQSVGLSFTTSRTLRLKSI